MDRHALTVEYAQKLLEAFRPAMNKALAENQIPKGLDRSELVRVVTLLLVKVSWDFAAANGGTIPEFSNSLREFADAAENELLQEAQARLAEMEVIAEKSGDLTIGELEALMAEGARNAAYVEAMVHDQAPVICRQCGRIDCLGHGADRK